MNACFFLKVTDVRNKKKSYLFFHSLVVARGNSLVCTPQITLQMDYYNAWYEQSFKHLDLFYWP